MNYCPVLYIFFLSTLVCFSDPWSGHSSVIPRIGAWSRRGCCHGNCQGHGWLPGLKSAWWEGRVHSKIMAQQLRVRVTNRSIWDGGGSKSQMWEKSADWLSNQICLSSTSWVTDRAGACESAKAGLELWLLFLDLFSPCCDRNFNIVPAFPFFQEDAASCKITAVIVLYRCPIIDSHIEQIVSLMYQTSGAKLTSSSRGPLSQRGTLR